MKWKDWGVCLQRHNIRMVMDKKPYALPLTSPGAGLRAKDESYSCVH
jgi:hypothetical protein